MFVCFANITEKSIFIAPVIPTTANVNYGTTETYICEKTRRTLSKFKCDEDNIVSLIKREKGFLKIHFLDYSDIYNKTIGEIIREFWLFNKIK